MKTSSTQRGFTWIETAAVMTIFGVVTTQAVPAMSGLVDSRRLEGTAIQFATDVQYARTEAISRNQPVRLSLHTLTAGTCYVLHTGLRAQCSCNAAGPATCNGDAREIKTVFLPSAQGIAVSANATSVAFDPLHGTSTPTATIKVLGPRGRAIHHVINLMGRVRTCTPAGVVVGYVAC